MAFVFIIWRLACIWICCEIVRKSRQATLLYKLIFCMLQLVVKLWRKCLLVIAFTVLKFNYPPPPPSHKQTKSINIAIFVICDCYALLLFCSLLALSVFLVLFPMLVLLLLESMSMLVLLLLFYLFFSFLLVVVVAAVLLLLLREQFISR